MSSLKNIWFAVAGAAVFAMLPTAPAVAADAGTVIVSIYYVAPGKQVDFLKWAAEQDGFAKEAGVAASQWYAHQDKKVDEVAKKHGKKTGMAAGLVMRQYISSHTDTFAYGPVSAPDLLKHVTQ
jgi:hypothetical protein